MSRNYLLCHCIKTVEDTEFSVDDIIEEGDIITEGLDYEYFYGRPISSGYNQDPYYAVLYKNYSNTRFFSEEEFHQHFITITKKDQRERKIKNIFL